eukprot:31498-Pelagococcus_subviridis.AAC.12
MNVDPRRCEDRAEHHRAHRSRQRSPERRALARGVPARRAQRQERPYLHRIRGGDDGGGIGDDVVPSSFRVVDASETTSARDGRRAGTDRARASEGARGSVRKRGRRRRAGERPHDGRAAPSTLPTPDSYKSSVGLSFSRLDAMR